MTVIREVTLCRRPGAEEPGHPSVLVVRLWQHVEPAGRSYELRGEDPGGNLCFSFRDPRRMDALEEFERTLAELLEHYAPSGEPRLARG